MTTELEQTKGYRRLDWYADLIMQKVSEAKTSIQDYIKSYFNAALEENIPEEEAKRYLRSKIPNSTFYKYLPETISKQEKSSRRKYSTVENNQQEESSTVNIPTQYQVKEAVQVKDFDTKGMGSVVTDDDEEDEPEEVTQTVNCPTPTNNSENDEQLQEKERIINELRKEIANLKEHPPHITTSDVANTIEKLKDENNQLKEIISSNKENQFTKGSDLPQPAPQEAKPPVNQVIILPHKWIGEIVRQRANTGMKGFIQLETESGIVTGLKVIALQ